MFEKTKDYWETWSSRCRLPSRYSEAVLRSALVLKLMTYEETGAIIAAPTTSLPEIIGQGRNWDYRYCWLRDASLMLEALKSIGHFEEARAFIYFFFGGFLNKKNKSQNFFFLKNKKYFFFFFFKNRIKKKPRGGLCVCKFFGKTPPRVLGRPPFGV